MATSRQRLEAVELAYIEWLATQRGVSLEHARAAAQRPLPRLYEIKRAPIVERWDNVVNLRPRRDAA